MYITVRSILKEPVFEDAKSVIWETVPRKQSQSSFCL